MWAGQGDLLVKNAYGCLLLLLSQDPGVLRLFLSNLTLLGVVLSAAGREGGDRLACCLLLQSCVGDATWTTRGLHLIRTLATHQRGWPLLRAQMSL